MSPGERSKERKLAAQRRNAALVRVDSARRWLIGGSVALTCALAVLVDALAPGHSASGATATTASSSSGSTSASGSSGYSGNSGSSGYYVTPSTGSSQSVSPIVSGGS
jgi:hypothetical protein